MHAFVSCCTACFAHYVRRAHRARCLSWTDKPCQSNVQMQRCQKDVCRSLGCTHVARLRWHHPATAGAIQPTSTLDGYKESVYSRSLSCMQNFSVLYAVKVLLHELNTAGLCSMARNRSLKVTTAEGLVVFFFCPAFFQNHMRSKEKTLLQLLVGVGILMNID